MEGRRYGPYLARRVPSVRALKRAGVTATIASLTPSSQPPLWSPPTLCPLLLWHVSSPPFWGWVCLTSLCGVSPGELSFCCFSGSVSLLEQVGSAAVAGGGVAARGGEEAGHSPASDRVVWGCWWWKSSRRAGEFLRFSAGSQVFSLLGYPFHLTRNSRPPFARCLQFILESRTDSTSYSPALSPRESGGGLEGALGW